MNVTITPTALRGTIAALPSKSQAHRLLLCAAFAQGETTLILPPVGQDVEATVRCLRALGADIRWSGNRCHVRPITEPRDAVLDVGESGTTLRFLLCIVCALGIRTTIRLHGRLAQRPLEPLWSVLQEHGAQLSRDGNEIDVSGSLTGQNYSLAANISSQFLSGILLALPLLGGGTLRLEGSPESTGYLDLTLDALRQFGIHAERRDCTIQICGTLQSPGTCIVEGDWSNAAFWLCANALGSGITVTGLNPNSLQGDRAMPELLGKTVVDCRQIPDLVPALSVAAAFRPGETRFCHAERLRLKESDRIAACVALIRALGAQAEETQHGFTVRGSDTLPGGTVDSFNDHRIAMAAAMAGTRCPVTIRDAQAVEKSYAAFWTDYCRLGGRLQWEDAT